MRISDWSSDVCSSDLGLAARRDRGRGAGRAARGEVHRRRQGTQGDRGAGQDRQHRRCLNGGGVLLAGLDRKSVVLGRSVSVRVVRGGRRHIKNKPPRNTYRYDIQQIKKTNQSSI